MTRNPSLTRRTLAIVLAGMLAAGPALADKGGKGRGDEQRERRDEARGQERGRSGDDAQGQDRQAARGEHFGDPHRAAVREYYGGLAKGGRCPPGLAKKHNGCMPPGQAKKWELGRPLPRDLAYYDVPRQLAERLGKPPEGHRYVRVAGDILMIATGTALVVDAIEDLGRQR